MSRTRQQKRERLSAGFHIAPFLSEKGRPVLAGIDEDSCLTLLAEIPTLAPSINEQCKNAEQTLRFELGMLRHYADHCWLPRGVHTAPWRYVAMGGREGATLVAIDRKHRLRASMEIDDMADIDAMREILSTLLSRAEKRENKRDDT